MPNLPTYKPRRTMKTKPKRKATKRAKSKPMAKRERGPSKDLALLMNQNLELGRLLHDARLEVDQLKRGFCAPGTEPPGLARIEVWPMRVEDNTFNQSVRTAFRPAFGFVGTPDGRRDGDPSLIEYDPRPWFWAAWDRFWAGLVGLMPRPVP